MTEEKKSKAVWIYHPDSNTYTTIIESPKAYGLSLYGRISLRHPVIDGDYMAEAMLLSGMPDSTFASPLNNVPWDKRNFTGRFPLVSEACFWVEEKLFELAGRYFPK